LDGDSLRRIVLFKIGSRDVQLPRMIGAFLIIVSVLMLLNSGAVMFDSWQALKSFNSCVESAITDASSLQGSTTYEASQAKILYQLQYQDCKSSLHDITGAQVIGGQTSIELWKSRQFWIALMGPISAFFAWAIVFLFALFLFNNSSIVVPVEEVEVPVRPFAKHHKK